MLLYSTRKMNTRKIYHGLLSKILYCFTVFFRSKEDKNKALERLERAYVTTVPQFLHIFAVRYLWKMYVTG